MRSALLCFVAIWLTWPTAFAQSDPVAEFNEAYGAYAALNDQGRYVEAVPHAEKALGLAETVLANDPAQVAMMTYLYGEVLFHGHKVEKSIELLGLATERYRTVFGAQDIRVAEPLFLTADALHRRSGIDNIKRARRLLEEAYEIYRDEYGRNDPRLSEPLRRQGYNAVMRSDRRAAISYLDQAVSLTQDAGPDHLGQHVLNLYEYARVKLAIRSVQKGIEKLLEARDVLIRGGQQDAQFRLRIEALLIEAYERADESDKATEHVRYLARAQPRSENGSQEPVPLYRSIQKYPKSALRRCREGTVIVAFTIDAEGRVRDPTIVEAKPEKIFNEVALETVSRYRYKPRIRDGEFVETPGRTVRLIWELRRERPRRKGGC